MDHGQVFVLAIIGMAMFSGVVRTSMMARHGGRQRWQRHHRVFQAMGWGRGWGMPEGDDTVADQRKMQLLTDENEKLHGKVSRLEERIAVLERIATDPAERTAREIEALRNR